MKYLCLCYYDPKALEQLAPAAQEEIWAACAPHDAALKATGKVILLGSLSSPENWAHFAPRDGRPQPGNGPYRSTEGQAGAFLLIEADSDEEAREVASKHAAANYGEHLGFAVELCACESYELYRDAG